MTVSTAADTVICDETKKELWFVREMRGAGALARLAAVSAAIPQRNCEEFVKKQ